MGAKFGADGTGVSAVRTLTLQIGVENVCILHNKEERKCEERKRVDQERPFLNELFRVLRGRVLLKSNSEIPGKKKGVKREQKNQVELIPNQKHSAEEARADSIKEDARE